MTDRRKEEDRFDLNPELSLDMTPIKTFFSETKPLVRHAAIVQLLARLLFAGAVAFVAYMIFDVFRYSFIPSNAWSPERVIITVLVFMFVARTIQVFFSRRDSREDAFITAAQRIVAAKDIQRAETEADRVKLETIVEYNNLTKELAHTLDNLVTEEIWALRAISAKDSADLRMKRWSIQDQAKPRVWL